MQMFMDIYVYIIINISCYHGKRGISLAAFTRPFKRAPKIRLKVLILFTRNILRKYYLHFDRVFVAFGGRWTIAEFYLCSATYFLFAHCSLPRPVSVKDPGRKRALHMVFRRFQAKHHPAATEQRCLTRYK